MWSHVSGFFDLHYFWGSFIFLDASGIPSFPLLSSILLDVYTTFCLSVHQLVDIWLFALFSYHG